MKNLGLLALLVLGLSAPASALEIVTGINGGIGIFNSGIGLNPVFGIEVLDPLYKPLLAGVYANYSLLGGATQGSTSVNASLITFGLKVEYPLPLRGLAVGVGLGAGYETVPVNAGGTLAAGSNWVFAVSPEVAYDYALNPMLSVGLEADFLYSTAPTFSGVSGTALTAPVFLLRVRYAFGKAPESVAPAAPAPAAPATPAPAPDASKKKAAKKAKPKPKPKSDDDSSN